MESINHTTENINDNDVLLKLNDNWARTLTPVAVYLGIVLVVGIIGNVTVLLVYSLKFKKTTSTIFILILAVVDLITCLLAIPFHFIGITFPIMWVWNKVCKIFTFTLFMTVISAILLLDLIAFDRYRKICKPFKRQVSPRYAKTLSLAAICVSFVLSIPTIFIYGITIVETRTENITGTQCYVLDKYSNTSLNTAYNITLLALYIILITFMISMYINVGKTVLKLRALKRKRQTTMPFNVGRKNDDKNLKGVFDSGALSGVNVKRNESEVTVKNNVSLRQEHTKDVYNSNTTKKHSSNTGTKHETTDADNEGKRFLKVTAEQANLQQNGTSVDNLKCNSKTFDGQCVEHDMTQHVDNQNVNFQISVGKNLLNTTQKVIKTTISKPRAHESSFTSGSLKTPEAHNDEPVKLNESKMDKKLKTRIRITLMLFVVTVVFIISFLPYLVITVLVGDVNSKFWKNSSITEHVVFGIFIRSYLISSMSNPIIYWFLNQRFKDEVKKMFLGLLVRQCKQ